MNVTIVGGSGFVGTRLTKRLLAAGHTVKIADKNDSKTYPELRVYADVRGKALTPSSIWRPNTATT